MIWGIITILIFAALVALVFYSDARSRRRADHVDYALSNTEPITKEEAR